MKYLKYSGLYFVMIAIGHNVLKMAEADKTWYAFFYGGAILWYVGRIWMGCKSEYKPNSDAIIQMSKSKGISVADVIKLIEYCGD